MAVPTAFFDLQSFQRDLSKLTPTFVKSIRTEIKHQLVEIWKLAMKKHRHTTRSNTLNSSIQMQMNNDFDGQVHFDTGIADYGIFVHEGHGAPNKSVTQGFPYVWQPDRFLYGALAAREPVILTDLERAIRSGLAAAGLQ